MKKCAEDKLFKEIATAKNWKRVLMEIYRFAPNQIGDSIKIHKYHDNHHLAKKLKITGQELGNTIAFLEDQKLINTLVSSFSSSWSLTEKGFNVAIELEKELRDIGEKKMNHEIQLSLLFLTFILSSNGILNIFIQIFPNLKIFAFLLYIMFMLLFCIIISLRISKTI